MHLKEGKHDGHLGHYTDSKIHGRDCLKTYLAIMLTGILSNGYTPNDMLLSTLYLFPKMPEKVLMTLTTIPYPVPLGSCLIGYS